MRRDWLFRGVFAALFALTLYLMFLIFRPFLTGIAWATVLVVAFTPLYRRVLGWVRGRTWLAATALSLALAALVVVPAVIAAIKVGQGVVDGYHWLETAQEQADAGVSLPERIPALKDAIEFAGRYVDVESIDLKGMAISALRTVGNALAGKSSEIVADAVRTILTFIVMLVTMTVLFHEGPAVVGAARRFLPMSEADRDEVFRELEEVTRSVFFGVLATALVQGMVGGIGFAIAGLPQPVTFGAAMFFCALLPGGTAIVWGPAAIYLFATGSWGWGTFLLIWGVVAVSSIDNLIRPLFIGRGVRMHTLLIFFGLFGGMLAFGLVGLFVGPLIITFFLFLVEIARRDLLREVPAEPPEA
jgi:predicted PurR-regulated permease PerM